MPAIRSVKLLGIQKVKKSNNLGILVHHTQSIKEKISNMGGPMIPIVNSKDKGQSFISTFGLWDLK